MSTSVPTQRTSPRRHAGAVAVELGAAAPACLRDVRYDRVDPRAVTPVRAVW